MRIAHFIVLLLLGCGASSTADAGGSGGGGGAGGSGAGGSGAGGGSNGARAPGPPTNVVVWASNVGNRRSANLSWTEPTDTGASAIIRFEVESRPDPALSSSVLFPDATLSITPFSWGSATYTFAVRAVNSSGAGLWSEESPPLGPDVPSTELGTMHPDSSITLTPTEVVWLDKDTSGAPPQCRLMRCARAACTPILVAGQLDCHGHIVSDGTFAYWTVSNSIAKINLRTGAVSSLATGNSASGYFDEAIALRGAGIYVSKQAVSSGYSIVRVDLSTGAQMILASGATGSVRFIDADATHVYWIHEEDWPRPANSSAIKRAPLSPGASEVTLGGLDTPVAFSLSGASVYWLDYRVSGSVNRVSNTGAGAVSLSSGFGNPVALGIADGYLYWGGYIAGIYRMPLSGGAATALAGGFDVALAVDGHEVYWAETTNPGPSSVTRLRKAVVP